jgi:hypothetical protein
MKTLNYKCINSYFGYILLLVVGLSSCAEIKPKNDPNCGQWMLGYSNDNNWSRQSIVCDSLQMVSNNEAYVYVKGIKTHVFAEQLYPMFEPCR